MIGTRLEAYDLLGLLLAGALATCFIVSAAANDANPLWHVAMLVIAVVSYALGRGLGRGDAVLACAAVVGAILVTTLANGPSAFSGGPLAPPLGYANANGALFALGVAAAAVIAILTDRTYGSVLALAMLALTAVTTSKAALALALGIALTALIARWLGRWVALAAPVPVAVAVAVTVALGSAGSAVALPRLEAGLTERRTELWHDAVELVRAHPEVGVGPGMFAETSPTALGDADAALAHSVYLEVAAESGIPAAVLLGAVLLWVFGALFRSHQNSRLVVVGTAAVSAVAVHAAIDYVAHYPAVVAAAALLAGVAGARPMTAAECVPTPKSKWFFPVSR